MANEFEKKILAEPNAEKVRFEHNPQTGVTLITRRWPRVVDKRSEDVLTYLKSIESVTDPKMDRQTYAGNWRVVSVFTERDKTDPLQQGYYQVLSLGDQEPFSVLQASDCRYNVYRDFYFATPVMPFLPQNGVGVTYARGPTSWDEDTGLYSTSIDTTVSKYRTETHEVQESLSETREETQELGLTTQPIPDLPDVQGVVYDRDINIRDDCTKDVTTQSTLSKEGSVEFLSFSSPFRTTVRGVYENQRSPLQAIDVPFGSSEASNTINKDHTYSGSVTVETPTDDGEAKFDSESSPVFCEESVIYRARSSQVGTPDPETGLVYEASNSLRADGLYDSSFVARYSKEHDVYFRSSTTAFEKESTAQFINSPDLISAPEIDGSGFYRVTTTLNQDGTYNQSLVYRTGRLAAEAKYASARSALEDQDSAIYKSSPVQIDAPDAVQGQVYQTSNTLTEDGLYDATLRLATSIYKTLPWSSRRTQFSNESSVVYQNSRVVIDAPVPDAGGVYQVTGTLNQDGTYDQVLVYRAGTNTGEAEFESLNSALTERDSVLYKSRNTQVEAQAHEQGKISTATNSLGDDGLYDATLVNERSKLGTINFKSRNNLFTDQSTFVYQNTPTLLNAPEAGKGGTYTLSGTINQDGTYNQTLVYIAGTSNGEAEFDSLNSALADRNAVIYRNRPIQVDAQENEQGIIFTATNQLTDDGLYNARVEKNTSIEGSIGWSSRQTKFSQEASVLYRNSRTLLDAPSPAAGGVYSVSGSLNEDGTYDQVLVYRAGKNAGEAKFDSSTSALSDGFSVVYKSRTTQVNAPLDEQSVVFRATNTLTEEGLYDGSIQKLVSKPGGVDFASGTTAFSTESSTIYRNQTTPVNAPSSVKHGVYRVTGSLNEDGTYDQTVVYRTGRDSGEARYNSDHNALFTRDTAIYKSRTGPIDVQDSSQGTIFSSSNTLGDDGLYDAQFVKTVSKSAELKWKSRNGGTVRESSVLHRNRNSLLDAGSANNGLYSVSARLNPDGTYDQEIVYAVGKRSKAGFGSLNAALSTSSSAIYAGQPQPQNANNSSQGLVYRATSSIQNDGTYASTIVGQASRLGKIGFTSRATRFSQEAATVYRNAKTVPAIPGVGSGLYTMSGSVNEDATYNFNLTYRYGLSGAGAKYTSGSFYDESRTSVLYKSQNSAKDANGHVQQVFYVSQNTLGDDGLYDSIITASKSKPVTVNFVSQETPFKTTDAALRLNSVNVPPITVPDKGLYSRSVRVNRDGTFNINEFYTTGKGGRYARFKSLDSSVSTGNSIVYKDSPNKIAVTGSAKGFVYQATNSLTEEGLYTGKLDVVYNKPGKQKFSSFSGAFKDSTSVLYFNRQAPISNTAWAVGSRSTYKLETSRNSDGTYNHRLDVNRGKIQSAGVNWTDAQGVGRVYRAYGTDNPGIFSGLTAQNLYTSTLSFEMREDGLYNVKLSQRQKFTRLPDQTEIAFTRNNIDLTVYEHVNNGKGSTGIQYRTKTFTYNVAGKQKYSEALDFINGAKPGSYIDRKGGMFIAWECVSVETSTWEDDLGGGSLN